MGYARVGLLHHGKKSADILTAVISVVLDSTPCNLVKFTDVSGIQLFLSSEWNLEAANPVETSVNS